MGEIRGNGVVDRDEAGVKVEGVALLGRGVQGLDCKGMHRTLPCPVGEAARRGKGEAARELTGDARPGSCRLPSIFDASSACSPSSSWLRGH
mmetsp:Transcript_101383/g.180231  ORF Transcript_101383/g.180231 Transcript_101383/m.180231 type:complete len:92 (-) Transcript_101383:244-519(-)